MAIARVGAWSGQRFLCSRELNAARDPLRIDRHPATKGVRTEAVSFDDRTYVLLEP